MLRRIYDRYQCKGHGEPAVVSARKIRPGVRGRVGQVALLAGLAQLRGPTAVHACLLHKVLVASVDAGLELIPANVVALRECDVERLVVHHLLVHLSDNLGGLVRIADPCSCQERASRP